LKTTLAFSRRTQFVRRKNRRFHQTEGGCL
jgi:hypothetical protein